MKRNALDDFAAGSIKAGCGIMLALVFLPLALVAFMLIAALLGG